MNQEEYKAAVDRCCCFDSREIGIWWNLEFMGLLEKEGLKLKRAERGTKPAKHFYVYAPDPFPEGPIHWDASWIIER